jgi:cytochrome c oxidase assembly protein subunit 15
VLSRLRERPSVATVRRVALAALIANVGIVVSGGAVRLTGSGLGCPTWPRCTDDSFVSTPEMGLHGAIEFGNRLLTWLLLAIVVACVTAVLRQRPRRRPLVRLSLALLVGIFAQAALGGVTVLTGLHPLTVAAHFLLSMALVAVAVLLHERSGGTDVAPVPTVGPPLTLAAWLLVVLTAAVLVLGTVVTGAGPHSGDIAATQRLPFDPTTVTRVHAALVLLLLGMVAGVLLALSATRAPSVVRSRAVAFAVLVLIQGAVGTAQYLTGLPELLVGLHLLGAALVWVAVLRLLLSTRDRSRHIEPPTVSTPRPATSARS